MSNDAGRTYSSTLVMVCDKAIEITEQEPRDAMKSQNWHRVIACMQAEPTRASVQLSCLAALVNIGVCTGDFAVMGRGGSHGAILAAIKAHEQVEDLLMVGCNLLCRILFACQQLFEVFAQEGRIADILHVLRTHPSKERVTREALTVLATLTSISSACEAACAQGGVAAIFGAMKRFPQEEFLQTGACLAIVHVVQGCRQSLSQVLSGEGIGLVLRMMARHSGLPKLQEYGIDALVAIARRVKEDPAVFWNHVRPSPSPRQSSVILQLALMGDAEVHKGEWNVLEAVLHAMNTHTDDASVQASCCFALSELSSYETSQLIAAHDCLEQILSALQTHKNTVLLVKNACSALHLSCKTHADIVVDAGGIAIVMNAMDAHSNNADVVTSCLSVLNALAVSQAVGTSFKSASKVIAAGAVRSVVKIMKKHVNVAQVQAAGVNFFGFTAYFQERDQVGKEGSFEALSVALKTHRDSKDVHWACESTLDTFGQICEDKKAVLELYSWLNWRGVCSSCEKHATELDMKRLLKCSACTLKVQYCSAACQKAHWKEHKADCKANRISTAGDSAGN